MAMHVAWEVSKAGEAPSPMFVDQPTADSLIKQGVRPVTRFAHAGDTIVGFDANQARKAADRYQVQQDLQRRNLSRIAKLGDAVDAIMERVMGGGATRVLTGKEAGIARRLGVKPVSVSGDRYTFRVDDLDRAARKLSPSEQAGLGLESWYFQGR
jgi:hypothetical protein